MLIRLAKGFTIVELLIVIAVIGILAGIGTLGYRGVTQRAAETQSSSDISSVADKIELYYVTNKKFPAVLSDLGQLSVSPGTTINGYESNGTSYCLVMGSSKSGTKKYTARDDADPKEGDCNGWTPTVAQTSGGGSGGSGPTPPPAPSVVTVNYTTSRVKVGADYVQRYVITVTGGNCSVGTREYKMGVTGGSSPSWSSWPWQTSATRTQDLPEDGIYSPVDTTIYAKARCTDNGLSTEGNTAQRYNGSGGGVGGAI